MEQNMRVLLAWGFVSTRPMSKPRLLETHLDGLRVDDAPRLATQAASATGCLDLPIWLRLPGR